MSTGYFITFLVTVFFGSYIQGVAGFAMGMLIIAVMSGFKLIDLYMITAVVSLLSLVNILMSLQGHYHRVQAPFMGWLMLGQVPAIVAGVILLTHLNTAESNVLHILLGLFIFFGSLSMTLRPQPRDRVSSPSACFVAGTAGGLVGGLFSASGPVLGWFSYRQPLAVAEIRATLLGCFVITTAMRTLVVGVQGGLTLEVWQLTGFGLPLVFLGTWLARRYPPALSEKRMKQGAFSILVVMGGWILYSGLLSLYSNMS